MNAPQIIMVIWIVLLVATSIATHGKYPDPLTILKKQSMWPGMIGVTILTAVLCWGGFFDVPR